MSEPHIVLVDDDPAMLDSISAVLRPEWSVVTFDSAAAALDALEKTTPDLILSDIVMPQMGGFEFRRAYAHRFAERATPFLFLSSIGDPETMVAGLEAGADDFIVKPVAPELLRARLRVALRRRGPHKESSYRGDLSQIPFTALLQFCETKRFTGDVTIDAGDLHVTLPIRGGELDAAAAADLIDRLWDLPRGNFILRAATADFAGLSRTTEKDAPVSERPGRLSSVVVRGRRLQVQTELVDGDVPSVVTLVLAGSEPVAKTKKRVPKGVDVATLRSLIDAQHEEVEAATRDRVAALRHRLQHGTDPSVVDLDAPKPELGAKSSSAEGPAQIGVGATVELEQQRSAGLFDQGYERSRAGDWSGALTCWERARVADPDNKTLALNIEVARRKLKSGVQRDG
ncbi:MAG: two-component system response regulator [Polyangiales bacterium]